MPGVIMESESRNGSHTNHDRDRRNNRVNGEAFVSEKGQDKSQARTETQQNMTLVSPAVPNGINGNSRDKSAQQQNDKEELIPKELLERHNELPSEIDHITTGFVPLSDLLGRLSQMTHNKLSQKVLEVAHMPLPPSTTNGNASHITKDDDNSVDNLNKKLVLLDFMQETHAKWVKALVITEWSKKAEDVSKIIDLRWHLESKRRLYDEAVTTMVGVKKLLNGARVPNPDFKTAVEVLTTGKANWMPDLGYIAPPPLSPKELLRSLEKLNTLLSIRLNIHEYEKIPYHFKNYTIKSGRVTFTVPGEFEIDLTIADEDPESQFWFIDFRFLFSPTLTELAPRHHYHIESKVNAALLKDGLAGCYTYLHEMVLTHKISEFRRQAAELSRTRWIDGLKLEPLHRALCIQYWLDRYGKNGPRSWIILGVHSGRRKDGYHDPKATSRLFLRWFRDSKEVKDVDIPFDTVNISAEQLLKTVIALHTNHILSSTYNKLTSKPIFANREAGLSLSTSTEDPKESQLKLQLTEKQQITITIEPVMGRFIFSPASRMITPWEAKLNERSRDPANEAHNYIENLRCLSIAEELVSLGTSVGWQRVGHPRLSNEDLKPIIPKDTLQLTWFRRPGWREDWLIAVSLGMSGENWYLIELTKQPPTGAMKISSSIRIPIKGVSPTPTYTFMSSLHIFAGGLLSHFTNLRNLYKRRILHRVCSTGPPSSVRLPSIYIRLSDLLPSRGKSSSGKHWAHQNLKLTFQGLEPLVVTKPALPPSETQDTLDPGARPVPIPQIEQKATLVSEARMMIPISGLTILSERIDHDIAFHAKTGAFAFRLRSQVGESVIPSLIERLSQIERLVSFSAVIRKHEKVLKCDSTSLKEITFSYGMATPEQSGTAMDIDEPTNRSYKVIVDLSSMEGKMKLTLESGNPHIRVLDALDKVLNSNKGLDGVANLLPQTLYPLRAFDTIEDNWGPLYPSGEVFIFVRAFEWYNLRYVLKSNTPNVPPRKISFDIKMNHRRGVPWWFVRRSDKREPTPDDEIDAQLKSVWNFSGPNWRGMRSSAVARYQGIEMCLQKIDEVIRSISLDDLAPLAAQPPESKGQAQAVGQQPGQNQQQMRLQQQARQLQLPTPGHSQPHSQGSSQGHQQQRMPTPNMTMNMAMNQNQLKRKPSSQNVNPRSGKREVVEID
ncbi:mediator complex subunit [Clarireedia jacksonii]